LIALGGGEALSYGINCSSLTVSRGRISAYDLSRGKEIDGLIPLACRSTEGHIDLVQGSLGGELLLPPGAAAQEEGVKVRTAETPINFPAFTLPLLPQRTQSETGEGHYQSLLISEERTLQGRYVIDNLRIEGAGKLSVAAGSALELYVGNLSVEQGPLVSNNGSSNRCKFFYTGTQALDLHLDEHSHLCLVAPHADLLLEASGLALGAFAASRVEVRFAHPSDRFCYDPTAAQPVGTETGGVDAVVPGFQAVTVMGRQRF
jgi:hypothetical protein